MPVPVGYDPNAQPAVRWDEFLKRLSMRQQPITKGAMNPAFGPNPNGQPRYNPNAAAQQRGPVPAGWTNPAAPQRTTVPVGTGWNPVSAEEQAARQGATYIVPKAEFFREGLPDLGIPARTFQAPAGWTTQPLNVQLPATPQPPESGYGYGYYHHGGGGGGWGRRKQQPQTAKDYLQGLGLLNWTI